MKILEAILGWLEMEKIGHLVVNKFLQDLEQHTKNMDRAIGGSEREVFCQVSG